MSYTDSINQQSIPLHPKHRHELEVGSGISPEVLAARGVRTYANSAELRALGFPESQAQLAPGILIPVETMNGWDPTYAIKSDKPRPQRHDDGRVKTNPDGTVKYRKYEYQAGAPNHLDCPAIVREVADNPSVPLLITEGWKKVMKAITDGYHCIGLGGVWNWLGKHDTPFAIPLTDFGYFSWKGRKVAIVFDSDVATNPSVREARDRLRKFLESLGAIVLYIDLPTAPDGSKQGLDDYLVANPGANLWDMAYEAVDPEVARLRRELEQVKVSKLGLQVQKNKNIKAERAALVATVNYLEQKHADDRIQPVDLPGKGGGWYDVPCKAIAEQAGCSPKTAGGHMESGAQWGLYEKVLAFDPTPRVDLETGEVLPPDGPKKIFMRRIRPAAETLTTMITLEPKKEADNGWGGKRSARCPEHPNAGTVKKWHLHCQQCDRLLDEGETHQRPVYEDDTPPDKHAEELVDALSTAQDGVSQDDPYLEARLEEGISQDGPPRLSRQETHTSTPISQDDPYPPQAQSASAQTLRDLPMFAPPPPPMAVCPGCEDPGFCRSLGYCPYADNLKPLAPQPATIRKHPEVG